MLLFGKKIGMTQVFGPKSAKIPVTVLEIPTCEVTLIRTAERDGYEAVQVGCGKVVRDQKKGEKNKYLARAEFLGTTDKKVGDAITMEDLAADKTVTIVGITKGKGFQGPVKLHNFAGGPKSHGHRHVLRAGGSMGSRFPQHTRKGLRRAARMGGDRETRHDKQIVKVDKTKNLIMIKGGVPGANGTLVQIFQ